MGGDVREFNVCDRVACARGGSALSVEIIRIPTNLCTKVLEDFEIEEVSFSTLGEKALQSVRQANVRIGEKVDVIGLVLIGSLTL